MAFKTIKIIFLGEKGSGKSSLISLYLFGRPIMHKKPILFGSYCKTEVINDKEFQLNLCDTSGEQDFLRLQSMSYLDADLLVLCVDIAQRGGLKRAEDYAVKIKDSNVPTVLCLTKIDLESTVEERDIKEFVKKYQMNGSIKSTITDTALIKDAFEQMIHHARSNILLKEGSCCNIFKCCSYGYTNHLD